jgi:hypothetical protein
MEIEMTPITDNMFSTRVRNFLSDETIFTLEALAAYGLIPALRAPNIGQKSIKEMSDALHQRGMKFVDEGLESVYPSSRFVCKPNGYGGEWRHLEGQKERAFLMVDDLYNAAPVVSKVSKAVAELIETAAYQISSSMKKIHDLEKNNDIFRSDNEQLWLALTSPLAAHEAGLTVAGVLEGRRKRLLGVKEDNCGND